MVADLALQALMILVTVGFFLAMHNIPQTLLAKFRYRNRPAFQSRRHFVLGAQLLARARSAPSRSSRVSLAAQAASEADAAIALDPADAAAHILKSLALDLQGFKPAALESIEAALSPLTKKSLSDFERGDALFKRAELKIAVGKRARVDSAIDDLTESIKLCEDGSKGKAFRLLGECYEMKEMTAEAKAAYENALAASPEMAAAREALERLG
uniref:Uncharacterized protein n=1 Tax=Kalanchoe fedtschenkoi TaxID=63787 RepID=A0A7N1A2C4_KALFE